jgi:hypothetical protein
MSALVLAHQNSTERMVSLLNQELEKGGRGEGRVDYKKIQAASEEQLAAHAEVLKSETEKIVAAVAANGRLETLTAHRILLGLILSYIAGLVTIPVFQWFIPLIGPIAH